MELRAEVFFWPITCHEKFASSRIKSVFNESNIFFFKIRKKYFPYERNEVKGFLIST